jgi:prophage maintenance system killer protein
VSVEYLDTIVKVEVGEETVLAIAAGELDEEQTAAWLRSYLVAPSD